MPELAQDIIVTLVAIGAAYLVITRVFSLVSSDGRGNCDSCPTGQRRAATANDPGVAKPLRLIKTRSQAERDRSVSGSRV